MGTNMIDPIDIHPDDVQILLADLQVQIVAFSKTQPPKALSAAAGMLGELAGVFSLPVTVSVVPHDFKPPELLPELSSFKTHQHERMSASPFLDLSVSSALAGFRRKTLVVAGFATEVVVLQSAVAARKAGYRVLVPVDACGGFSERTEQAAFRQIELAGGELTSVVSLATAMAPDFQSDLGQKMFAVVQKLRHL
jgi:nicotinamidase-related amidase